MAELKLLAETERLDEVLEFVENELRAEDCPEKIIFQITVAVEEIFINIAKYAYFPKIGDVILRCNINNDIIVIEFLDKGTPYNPLEKIDPDITLSAEDRGVGGLGIFMTKKLMNGMDYEHAEGYNHLTIKKGWR